MSDIAKRVILTIPMYPDMELAAAKTASVLAELMDFGEGEVEEIQLAIIETCINAFEHSKSDDQEVHIEFLLMADELQFKVTDRGVGISTDTLDGSRVLGSPGVHTDLRKRGRGLQIIRSLMDEVDIESSPNGTTVSVKKKKKG
ncbi:MAG: ATP-binding protein [Candidatus Poribacteria bacterium]|nr:ATP-binding protein [Candidatus Poribacteria bacterium]